MPFFSEFLYKSICCGYSFELHRQVDAIQMGTHSICLYKEVAKQYTSCNPKSTDLLDCALIGVCAVIRSNTVVWFISVYDNDNGDSVVFTVHWEKINKSLSTNNKEVVLVLTGGPGLSRFLIGYIYAFQIFITQGNSVSSCAGSLVTCFFT